VKWEKVKLGDVCIKIGSGATPKGGSTVYIKKGIAFIRSQNVYNLYFDFSGLVFINEEAAKKLNGVTIEKNDILLNITGDSVARTCLAPEELLPARVNQHVAIVRPDKNILNPIFLNYYLASPDMQSRMLGLAVGKGASRNAMTKEMIASFKVPCPSLDIQNKIVNILKPYDDLIENNQNQIKLLEEAAQRLYKEWFVDFRFPGYEDTKFIDGIPDGWKVRPLSEIFDFIRGKSYASKELVDQGGVIMINLKNIKAFGGYKRNVEKRFIGKFKDEQKILAGDIVMGVTDMTKERRLVGYVAIIPNLGETAIFSMDLIKLIPKTVTRGYLYTTMLYGEYSKRISLLANGVNVLHLKPDAMMGITMLVPSEIIMEQYEHKFELYRQKIELLQTQCNIFTEARERLLPKLMSGEIEV
jgi:hypothetical protein